MEIIDLPKIAAPSKARFQIFLSGIAARYTFLLDTTDGSTWVVVTGKRKDADGKEFEVTLWEPFSD